LEELDVLLSSLPKDGTPLVVLGDFNIHLEKPQAVDFHTLLALFYPNWTLFICGTAPLTI